MVKVPKSFPQNFFTPHPNMALFWMDRIFPLGSTTRVVKWLNCGTNYCTVHLRWWVEESSPAAMYNRTPTSAAACPGLLPAGWQSDSRVRRPPPLGAGHASRHPLPRRARALSGTAGPASLDERHAPRDTRSAQEQKEERGRNKTKSET